MKNIRLLAALLLCFPVCGLAQLAPATDSLMALLDETSYEERVAVLHQLSDQYQRSNADSALFYAHQALDLSIQIENELLEAESRRRLGHLLSASGRNPEAIPHLLQSKQMFEFLGNLEREAATLGNLGALYMRQSDYQRALEYYFSSLKLWQQLNDQPGIANTYYHIAIINERMERPKQAIEFYTKSLQINEEQNDYSGIAINASSLATVYARIGHTDKAKEAVQKGLAATEKLPGEHARATILLELSSIYKDEKSYIKALEANNKALALAREMPDKVLESLALRNIASILREQQHFESANDKLMQLLPLLEQTQMGDQLIQTWNMIAQNYFDMAEWERSVFYANRAYERAQVIKAYEDGLKSLNILSSTFEQQANYREALRTQKAISVIKDSLYNREQARQIAELQTRYETEQKEQEIAQLQAKQAKANLLQNVFLVGLLVIAVIGFLVYNRQRLKIKSNKTALENTRLKEQKLKQDLKFKNKQLTTHSLNLVQKNEVMKELKQNIREIRNSSDGVPQKKLLNIEHLVDYSFNLDKDWEEFKLYFEEVHTGFFDSLKEQFPTLTPNELRLSALVKLNLTTKEIATIMGITPDSVKTARYRLRKKLGMETEENLTEFMMQIEKDELT